MTTVEDRPRWKSHRMFLLAWVLMSLLCATWAMSTPIAAVPDEPAHLIKAASVVRGELVGPTGENGQVVSVPRWVASTHSQACFAFDSALTADCTEPVVGDPAEVVRASTTAGLYNPLYYAIVGVPSLIFGDSTGVFGMRIVSGMLTSSFLAATFTIVAGLPRCRIAILAVLTATTPMVLFLGGAVNPNGVETAATLAAFSGTLALIIDPESSQVTSRATLIAVSASVAANMRGLSPVWLAIVLCAPLLIATRPALLILTRRRSIRWTIAVVGSAVIAAVAWILWSGSLVSGVGAAASSARPEVPFTGASPLRGFYSIVDGTFELAENMIGLFGWLDTPAPTAVYFVWSALVGSLLVAALTTLRGRELLLVIGLVGSVVLIPALVQALYITGGGYIWQGRYTLPLFVCAVVGVGVIVGLRLPEPAGQMGQRFLAVVVVGWSVAHFAAFALSIRRYSVGLPETWVAMVTSPAWSPPGGVFPILIAFGFLLWVCAVAGYRAMVLRENRTDPLGTRDPRPSPGQGKNMNEQTGGGTGDQR